MLTNNTTLEKWFLRLLAILAAVVAAVNPDSLPASVRAGFAVASGVILAADRVVGDPSIGNQPPSSVSPPKGAQP